MAERYFFHSAFFMGKNRKRAEKHNAKPPAESGNRIELLYQ